MPVSKPDDFDIIDEQALPRRRSRGLLPWLIGALILLVFGFAVGIAFMRISARWGDPSTPQPAEVAQNDTPTVPAAQATNRPQTTATPAPTSPTATVTPTSTATATPACVVAIASQFQRLEPTATLGCALRDAQVVWAAYERFERGAMLWRSDTDAAYAFADNGQWRRINERWDGQTPPSRGAPPPGLSAPERGFGYVWAIRDDLFQTLGWAQDREKGFCATVQDYARGFLLQSADVPSCTADNLYNHATAGDWAPLLLVARDDQQWSDGLRDGAIATPAPASADRLRPAGNGVVYAFPPTRDLTLDGNLSDWPSDWLLIESVVQDSGAFSGGGDLSARFQVLYTEQGLVVAVRVQDDLFRPGPVGSNQWQGDGLEIQFDRQLSLDYANSSADDDDTQLGLAPDETVDTLRGYRWLPFAAESSWSVPGAVSSLGSGQSWSGYNAEFLIPWSMFGLRPAEAIPGAAFGFNLSVNDNDGPSPAQQTVLSFSPRRTTHDNPTEWATLVLAP